MLVLCTLLVVIVRSLPTVATPYKKMYELSLKSSGKQTPVELCHLLCGTLQQVEQLQQQLNKDTAGV